MPLEAGHRLGRYEIRALLGVGGMGEVYLAHDTKLNRKVALKLLLGTAAANQDRLRRFTQEAQAASALNHPNIVTVHDVDVEAGVHYITTEFIEGETLRRRLERGALPLADAIRIAVQVADALVAAHREGIVHRDIKPENILLRPDGYVKVVDFGLAKLAEAAGESGRTEVETRAIHKTAAGVVLGTVAYMSPEQARGLPVDRRTDVWSLGVVLYEMIAGRRPFEGPTSSDVIAFILHKDPPKLAAAVPEVTGEVELVVETALTKDAEERYQSGRELLNALKRVRHHLDSDPEHRRADPSGATGSVPTPQPGSAPLVTPPAPAQTAAQSTLTIISNELRRHRRVLVAAAIGLVACVALGGYAVYRVFLRQRAPLPFEHFAITRLTTSGKVLDAAISPDGRYVVHSVGDQDGESLLLRRVKTDSNISLTPAQSAGYNGLTFSPDGEYVYYVRSDWRDPAGVLYQVPVLGGTERLIADDVDSSVTFSPDGTRMAFVRGTRDNKTSVIVANPDGSNQRPLATVDPPQAFTIDYNERVGPAWSPDGRSIAAVMNGPDGKVMAIVDTTNGSVRVLGSRHWFSIRRPGWLADSSGVLAAVAESANAFEAHQVWLMPASGAEPRRITSDLNNYGAITTSAGNGLVAVQMSRDADVWVTRGASAATAVQLTSSGASIAGAFGLTWTPDNRLIFFMSGGELWSMNADGADRKPLALGFGVNHHPTASPDGKYIVFLSGVGASPPNLWRATPSGSNPVQLTKDGAGIFGASISPDSRIILFAAGSRVWRMSIDGGPPTAVTNKTTGAAVVSPDGKSFACLYRASETAPPQLAFYPFDGGKPLRLFDLPPHFLGHLRWAPDSQAVQFLEDRGGISNIWSMARETGAVAQVTQFAGDEIYDFAWSLDGTRLALSRGHESSDAVLLTDAR